MPFVGHAPIRARGTIGGSLANADPAAEIALAAVTLAATLVYRGGDTVAECAGRGFLHRADDDGAARGRLPDGSAISGLARGAHRRGFPRGQCPPERFRLCLGGGADRARRRRHLPACRDRRRRHHRRASAARCGGRRARRQPGARKQSPATPCARRSPISSCCRICMHRPIIAAAPRRPLPYARSPKPIGPPRARMPVELNVNGQTRKVEVEPRTTLLDCLRDRSAADRRACRLRARRLRRLHRAVRRRAGALLPDVRGAGRRLRHHHHRRLSRRGRASCRRSRMHSARRTACNAAIARRP